MTEAKNEQMPTQAELEALRKDAERYRWIRNNCAGEPRRGAVAPTILLYALQGKTEDVWIETAITTNDLSATIDAAMKT